MPVQLYNEGRVVGYSAYELYVRHSQSEGQQPASELEWLSSSIAMGSSMLLEVRPPSREVSGPHSIDIPLPTNTKLCAANTIIGSFFSGEGYVTSTNPWATKVTDYGYLLANDNRLSPSTYEYKSAVTLPSKGCTSASSPDRVKLAADWSDDTISKLREYMKIVDGLILQPGTWAKTASGDPASDLTPNLSSESSPCLRLLFSEKITESFFILLTGFTLSSVISGVTGTDGSTDTANPENGDFLGPAVYPWANKIVFSVPPSYVNYFLNSEYSRQLPYNYNGVTGPETDVPHHPIIDMVSTDPRTYYRTNHSDSAIPMRISDVDEYHGGSILTVYQRDKVLPPALFGTKANTAGEYYLNPIDTVAPGTVKLYHDDIDGVKAKSLETNVPYNYAFTRDPSSYVIYELNQSGSLVPVSDTYTSPLYGTLMSSEPLAPFFHKQHNAGDPTDYMGFGATFSRRISGSLSDEFRHDCGIEYGSELFNAIISTEIPLPSGSNRVNKSMCSDLISNPEIGKKYYYVLQGSSASAANATYISGWTLVPILIEGNRLDYVEKAYGYQSIVLPWISPPFSNAANTDNLKYLGTWWNEESIEGHEAIGSVLKQANPSIAYIQDADRSVPLGNGDATWEDVYRTTYLYDIFNDSELDGTSVTLTNDDGSDFVVKYTKIHKDYRSMTLHDLLEVAKTHNVTTKELYTFSDESKNTYEGMRLTKYFAFTAGMALSVEKGLTVVSSVNMSTSINESNAASAVTISIPPKYISPEGPQGVVNISGNHQTLSLAMSDANNQPYQLTGISGLIAQPRDSTLHWDDLVDALANNKSIDIVGESLRSLSNALSGKSDGEYVLSIKNGKVTVTDIDDVIPQIVASNANGTINTLKFPRGMKLFISNGVSPGSNPAGLEAPKAGDIGIGW